MLALPAVILFIKQESSTLLKSTNVDEMTMIYFNATDDVLRLKSALNLSAMESDLNKIFLAELHFSATGKNIFGHSTSSCFKFSSDLAEAWPFNFRNVSCQLYAKPERSSKILQSYSGKIFRTATRLLVCHDGLTKPMYESLCRRGQRQRARLICSAFITKNPDKNKSSTFNSSKTSSRNEVPTYDSTSVTDGDIKILVLLDPPAPLIRRWSRVLKVFFFSSLSNLHYYSFMKRKACEKVWPAWRRRPTEGPSHFIRKNDLSPPTRHSTIPCKGFWKCCTGGGVSRVWDLYFFQRAINGEVIY